MGKSQRTRWTSKAAPRDAGRDEARRIGVAIKRLEIPVGEVMASPFCRTMETAQLIFGRATATAAVRGGPARPDTPDRYAELRKLRRGSHARQHHDLRRADRAGRQDHLAAATGRTSNTILPPAHAGGAQWTRLAVE